MKKFIITGIVLITLLYSNSVSAIIACRFIYPVLGDGQTIQMNVKDPRECGWYDSGNPFGHYYPTVPIQEMQLKKLFYHPAEDWNRDDKKEDTANVVGVYSISDGEIVRIEKNNKVYGETILVRYELPQEIDFTKYFLNGTVPIEKYKKSKYIIAQWMHIIVKDGLKEEDQVKLGQELGVIDSDFNHLHYELMVDTEDSWVSTARNLCGYYESQQSITDHGYINPSKFVKIFNEDYPVGTYSDGFHTDGTSQAFLNCYTEYSAFLGSPFDHDGNGIYVHLAGGVYVQDFQQDPSQPHWGDGETCMILNEEMQEAFIIKEGFRDKYFEIAGFDNLGAPTSNEYVVATCNESDGKNYRADIAQTFQKGSMLWDGEIVEVEYTNTADNSINLKLSAETKSGEVKIAISNLNAAEIEQPSTYKASDDNYLYPYLENVPTDLTELGDMLKILNPTNIYRWDNTNLAVVADNVAHMITDTADFLLTFKKSFEDFPLFRYYDENTGRDKNITNTCGMNARWREMKQYGWLIPSGLWPSECENRWREYLIDGRKLGDYINVTPEFLAEYQGRKIKTGLAGQATYLITETGINELGPYRGGMDFLIFELYSGLQPAGKLSWTTEEAFRYFSKSAEEYIRAAKSGFGRGAQYAPEEYQGDYNPTEFEIFFQEQKEAGMTSSEILQLWHRTQFSETLENAIEEDWPEVVEVTGNEAETEIIEDVQAEVEVIQNRIEITKKFYVGAGDGFARELHGGGVNRSDLVEGQGNGAWQNQTMNTVVGFKADQSTNKWEWIHRGIFPIDTSCLPDSATIVSATFYVYGGDKDNGLDSNMVVNVYSADPVSTSSLEAGDYDSLGSTAYSTAIAYANLSISGYNSWSFNSDGRNYISKTGYTSLGLRDAAYDVANSSPTWVSAERTQFSCYFADETGTSKDPYLEITYICDDTEGL